MKIDEEAGLPELLKGYFWRVGNDVGTVTLELRRRTVWGWSVKVTGEHVAGGKGRPFYLTWDRDAEYISESLVRTARSILRSHQRQQEGLILKSRLTGDYPPKTLSTHEEESN